MKIKIVLILSIFVYPQWTTQDNVGGKNHIICNIAGRVWNSTYVFNMDELPDRCDVFIVGRYVLNPTPPRTNTYNEDQNVLKSLVEANKCIYTRLGFPDIDNWAIVSDPSDKNKFQAEIFDPLVKFLIEFKIKGLLLEINNLYEVYIDDLATKISCFGSAIKEKVDKLEFGLIIDGWYCNYITDNSFFDFSITNKVMDIYVIKMMQLNECFDDRVKTGVSPVTSTDKNIMTIEKITSAVISSSMDKSKVYVMIEMIPVLPKKVLPNNKRVAITTYSIYCSSTDKCNSSQWCTNPSQLIYDQGKYAKNVYAGISLEQLDTDDYEGKCECGLFPVTNLVIDGWTGTPFKDCPALDKN